MTILRSNRIREGYEPIPGYLLEERIGEGGFGEVWRASAPGGLKKAVKFVFGTQDQSRATRELRSLERIRGVHHPFLLTLERFEAIDDQLVIVTELADCSLEDVYRSNRDHGSCGIARDVLISHLLDTADALDYLHQAYQLQHLDIKPGNLLLVGGRVKIADFGLVKDLREADCSVVGGLTPIYAPPELFDGRPSLHSDQYSLAVMYQELLTGTRPFSGRTIAQLATQHVHGAPNLEPLPASDRPVMAKALEKNPERRFPNCKAFVEAIRDSQRSRSIVVTPVTDTEAREERAVVEDLPLLADSEEAAIGNAPVLVVALGGTGARCLQALRQRVNLSHSARPVSMHGILIDTDAATIDSMRIAEAAPDISPCTLIHTPLKTPQEYRRSGAGRLGSISRRWIYNVPRSGATEGIRPLGRLALVDHGPVVLQKLTEAIESLASVDGPTPTIYVLGSLAGGTASGIYIDVVHLLRHLLDQSGLVEARILSMLATPPLQCDPTKPLASHDTQAAINELVYLMQPGNGYPGDQGAGWPSVPAARTPLRDLYFVAGPSRNSLTAPAIDTIVDYLWSDFTGASELLEAAREIPANEGTSITTPAVRTVGIVPLSDPRRLQQELLAPAVVRELLVEWLGLPSKARQDAIAMTQRIFRRVGLSIDTFARESNDESSTSSELFAHLVRELSVCMTDRRADLTTNIESLKRIEQWTAQSQSEIAGSSTVDSSDRDDAIDTDDSIDTDQRVTVNLAASVQLERFAAQVTGLRERLEDLATTIALSVVETTKLQSSNESPWDRLPKNLQAEFETIVGQLHTAVCPLLVRSLQRSEFRMEANQMVEEMVRAAMPLIDTRLDEAGHSLQQTTSSESAFGDSQQTAPIGVTKESHTNTAVTQAIVDSDLQAPTDRALTMEEAILAVKPPLLSLGGSQRLLLVVGSEHEKQQLQTALSRAYEGPLTVAIVPGSRPKLIHEAQGIELGKLEEQLMIISGGNQQVTSRLASRTDLDW